MSSTITNTISCYPDSLLEPRVSIYSVPNILRISLLGPSTNLRPAHTNLSPISLPHVTKLRYCRGLLAGSRAEVVGVMEIWLVLRPSIRGYTWIIGSLPVDPFDLPLFEEVFVQATRSFFGHCEFRRGYSLRSRHFRLCSTFEFGFAPAECRRHSISPTAYPTEPHDAYPAQPHAYIAPLWSGSSTDSRQRMVKHE